MTTTENPSERVDEWKTGLGKIAEDLAEFMEDVKNEWFFKALSNLFENKGKELTEEQKKTQEKLNTLGDQLIKRSLSNFEDSVIWNEIEIQNSLEQDLQNEETVLWLLSKDEWVKSWFMWFTSWLDDWLNVGGRTGKEIKADWFEFVLLAARKLSDDNGNPDWRSDLTLQDLETLWKKLWDIKKICEDVQTTSGKSKEQVLAVCSQMLKDKLKTEQAANPFSE